MKTKNNNKKVKNLSLYKLVPNMITLTAMAAGMTAIKFAIIGKWEFAVIAVVVAAFMDAFDGAAARLLKAQSKLGAELDSLSDFLCFGVAPALIVFLWTTQTSGKLGWIVPLIFTMAVALRLARFNITHDNESNKDSPLSKYFEGIPAPIGAGLSLLPMIVSFQMTDANSNHLFIEYTKDPIFVCGWLIILSSMMVSHIPTFSSKQIRVPQKMSIIALAVFGIILSGLINNTWLTLTFLGVVYLIMMPLSVLHYNKKKRSLALGIEDPEDSDIEE